MIPISLVTLDDVKELTEDFDIVFVDTETIGLYGKIRLLQVYNKALPKVLLVEWPDPLMLMIWLSEKRHAWHNAHYDISTIQKQSNTKIVPKDYEDTFLLSRLHFCKKQEFSLDKCFEYVLGEDPYKTRGFDKKAMQKSKWDGELTEEQLTYAAIDVYFMPDLYEVVEEQKKSTSYKLDMLTLNYCLDFQHNGIPTDQTRITKKMKDNLAEIDSITNQDGVEPLTINVNSPKQVKELLGTEDSKAGTLIKMYLQGGPLAGLARRIKDIRKLRKQNTFLEKFDTDRIYGYFKPSARSGRLTSNAQNLQQIPRELKGMFTAPDGRVFVRADYSQLELRAACAITNEPVMESILRAGDDLHDHTATKFFGPDFTKEQRTISKCCNFNLLYGGSAKMLGSILLMQAGMLIPDSVLMGHKRRWNNLYLTITRWQERKIAAWRRGTVDSTPFGRKYVGKVYTDQMNIEVQGFGAEISKLALHYMYDKLLKCPGNPLLINFVHDDYMVECDDNPESFEATSKIIADKMQEAWGEACKTLPITDLPMPIEVKVGKNWGDMEEDKGIIYELEQ